MRSSHRSVSCICACGVVSCVCVCACVCACSVRMRYEHVCVPCVCVCSCVCAQVAVRVVASRRLKSSGRPKLLLCWCGLCLRCAAARLPFAAGWRPKTFRRGDDGTHALCVVRLTLWPSLSVNRSSEHPALPRSCLQASSVVCLVVACLPFIHPHCCTSHPWRQHATLAPSLP